MGAINPTVGQRSAVLHVFSAMKRDRNLLFVRVQRSWRAAANRCVRDGWLEWAPESVELVRCTHKGSVFACGLLELPVHEFLERVKLTKAQRYWLLLDRIASASGAATDRQPMQALVDYGFATWCKGWGLTHPWFAIELTPRGVEARAHLKQQEERK